MRVLGARIDLELGGHLATKAVLRQHADDGVADDLIGPVDHQIAVAGGGEAARVATVAIGHLASALPEVRTTLSELITITWSPMSGFGANMGLCLPRSTEATSVASRPRTRPSASTILQARVISAGLGVYVRTGVPCSVRLGWGTRGCEVERGRGPGRSASALAAADLGRTREAYDTTKRPSGKQVNS